MINNVSFQIPSFDESSHTGNSSLAVSQHSHLSIADHVALCWEAFRELLSNLAGGDTPTAVSDEKRRKKELIREDLQSSSERFQLWYSNVGAHRRDGNSLDRRLWEAVYIRENVIEYLKDLHSGIKDASGIATGVTIPWDEISDSSSDDDGDDTAVETQLGQLTIYIKDIVTCLLRVATIIQKPAPHDRFIKSGRFDQSFRQPWDKRHVEEKFVGIPEWISRRPGTAITRRRQFLEYRKSHHEQIAEIKEIDDFETMERDGTVVSSLPTVVKQDQGVRAFLQATATADHQSNSGDSLTSYAETVAGEDVLLVPKMPEANQEGGLFQCPYCYMILGNIHNRLQWKRHVYTDLRPYICLHQDCASSGDTFSCRREWIAHENGHAKRWQCQLCLDDVCLQEQDMREHLEAQHSLRKVDDSHLLALSRLMDGQSEVPRQCALCHSSLASVKQYYRHTASHLEQLALFALPKDELEDVTATNDDESGVEDTDHSASLSEFANRTDNLKDTRPFPCPFSRYGCRSNFTSKNEWKRHVSTQHIKLGFWRCDLCSMHVDPKDDQSVYHNDFNRKDLFTQHLRRMHAAPANRSSNDIKTYQVNEDNLAAHQERCYQAYRQTPPKSSCLFCLEDFSGPNAWEDRMEHVGRHMERDRNTLEVGDVSGWREDQELENWLVEEGLIARDEEGHWRIGDGKPLRLAAGSESEDDLRDIPLATEPAAGPSADPTRVTTMVQGREIDITDLGLDVEYLEALPEDLREETIHQRIADQGSRSIEERESSQTQS